MVVFAQTGFKRYVVARSRTNAMTALGVSGMYAPWRGRKVVFGDDGVPSAGPTSEDGDAVACVGKALGGGVGAVAGEPVPEVGISHPRESDSDCCGKIVALHGANKGVHAEQGDGCASSGMGGASVGGALGEYGHSAPAAVGRESDGAWSADCGMCGLGDHLRFEGASARVSGLYPTTRRAYNARRCQYCPGWENARHRGFERRGGGRKARRDFQRRVQGHKARRGNEQRSEGRKVRRELHVFARCKDQRNSPVCKFFLFGLPCPYAPHHAQEPPGLSPFGPECCECGERGHVAAVCVRTWPECSRCGERGHASDDERCAARPLLGIRLRLPEDPAWAWTQSGLRAAELLPVPFPHPPIACILCGGPHDTSECALHACGSCAKVGHDLQQCSRTRALKFLDEIGVLRDAESIRGEFDKAGVDVGACAPAFW